MTSTNFHRPTKNFERGSIFLIPNITLTNYIQSSLPHTLNHTFVFTLMKKNLPWLQRNSAADCASCIYSTVFHNAEGDNQEAFGDIFFKTGTTEKCCLKKHDLFCQVF